MQKSYMAKLGSVSRDWYVIDANDKVLGRLAVQIAKMLMGKTKPQYTPHADTGDFIVVTNVEKIKVTGTKEKNKVYYTWTGYPGGLRTHKLSEWRKTHPDRLLRLAVRRMLPKNTLGDKMLKKLKIYAGSQHPHQAQCPKVWTGTI